MIEFNWVTIFQFALFVVQIFWTMKGIKYYKEAKKALEEAIKERGEANKIIVEAHKRELENERY